MLLLLALVCLVFLPSPWGLVAALASSAAWILEVAFLHRRVRGRKIQTGVENLVGATGEVTDPLMPVGQVRVLGELWQARASSDLPRGTPVRVVALEDLVVQVEAADNAHGSR